MSNAVQSKATPVRRLKTTPLMKRTISYTLLALVFFLLGFLPVWVQGRATAGRVSEMEQALRVNQMENDLGAAVIVVQRGEYEPARQAAAHQFRVVKLINGPLRRSGRGHGHVREALGVGAIVIAQ